MGLAQRLRAAPIKSEGAAAAPPASFASAVERGSDLPWCKIKSEKLLPGLSWKCRVRGKAQQQRIAGMQKRASTLTAAAASVGRKAGLVCTGETYAAKTRITLLHVEWSGLWGLA